MYLLMNSPAFGFDVPKILFRVLCQDSRRLSVLLTSSWQHNWGILRSVIQYCWKYLRKRRIRTETIFKRSFFKSSSRKIPINPASITRNPSLMESTGNKGRDINWCILSRNFRCTSTNRFCKAYANKIRDYMYINLITVGQKLKISFDIIETDSRTTKRQDLFQFL